MMGSSCVSLWLVGHFPLDAIENPQGVYWQMLPTGHYNREFSFLPAPPVPTRPICSTFRHAVSKNIFFSVPSIICLQQKLWIKYASRPKALSPPALSSALPFPLHLFLRCWLCVRSSIRVLRYPREREGIAVAIFHYYILHFVINEIHSMWTLVL